MGIWIKKVVPNSLEAFVKKANDIGGNGLTSHGGCKKGIVCRLSTGAAVQRFCTAALGYNR